MLGYYLWIFWYCPKIFSTFYKTLENVLIPDQEVLIGVILGRLQIIRSNLGYWNLRLPLCYDTTSEYSDIVPICFQYFVQHWKNFLIFDQEVFIGVILGQPQITRRSNLGYWNLIWPQC